MLNRRGTSHLEIVLSFFLFLFAIIILISYVKPYQKASFSETIVDSVHENLIKNARSNYTRFSLKAIESLVPSCLSLDLTGFPLPLNGNSVVKKLDGTFVNSQFSSSTLNFEMNGAMEFVIFISPEFPSLLTPPSSCTTNYTLIGGAEFIEGISNSSLFDLNKSYYSNYNALKNTFGVTKGKDFVIISENYNLTRDIPEEVEVISKSYLDYVIYANGDIKQEEIIVKVW